MRAFETMHEVVNDLKDYQILSEEALQTLHSSLNCGKSYLKSHYQYNLRLEDPCPAHCVAWSLSDPDPKNAHFRRECLHGQEHDGKCDFCTQLNDTFDAIKGFLTDAKESGTKGTGETMTEELYQDVEHEIEVCSERIFHYKAHLLRTWAQLSEWQDLRDNWQEGQAFVVMDWAMKVSLPTYLPTYCPMFHRKIITAYFPPFPSF